MPILFLTLTPTRLAGECLDAATIVPIIIHREQVHELRYVYPTPVQRAAVKFDLSLTTILNDIFNLNPTF